MASEGEGVLKTEGLPEKLRILPLRNMVLYPDLVLPLHVTRAGYRRLADEVYRENGLLAVVAQRNEEAEEASPADIYQVGTVGSIIKLLKQADGTYQIIVGASEKVRLRNISQAGDYLEAEVEAVPEDRSTSPEIEALALNLRMGFQKFVSLASLPLDLANFALNAEHPMQLVYAVASHLALSVVERQSILEMPETKAALEHVTFYMTRQLEKLELAQRIQDRVKSVMDKRQRDYYLREQLQAIRKELGEGEDTSEEVHELAARLRDLEMPAEARGAAEKEIERLGRMSPSAPEYHVSRNYLDWLLEMPWSASTEDRIDVRQAAVILDEDHFDLEKVKRRILEYLAVLQLKKDLKGPILCFVGPPGVGKTSLGQSIARTLGRKFLRISLGGVRDEAEIRGHRRTYVGALPGRIVQGLRRVGSNNPVLMLDEIDKIGMDFRGDPSSALLEVLDPEQNFSFSDHYLGVPFDLSKVMFIATGNLLDTVPAALKDRMEVIEIPGYTAEEKLEIARKFLVERETANHGLTSDHIRIGEDAILEIIRSYTREAGVRSLQRNLASVCRNTAKAIAEGASGPIHIDAAGIPEILGPVQFLPETATRSWGCGIATGLAWTPSGGQLIFIETLRTHGNGKLLLTGQLGEVMKESATAALTFVRAHAAELEIEGEEFDRSDIHVHVPAGATPKDGPSAGAPIVVALASLMTGREVRKDVAMTGEITLRGDILPVGGIKEKVLAARRAGVKEIMIPHANMKDLADIPDHLRRDMTIHELQTISDALQLALLPSPRQGGSSPRN